MISRNYHFIERGKAMADVIDLSTFKNQQTNLRKEKTKGGNLTELLKMATILRQSVKKIEETIVVMDFEALKRVFEARLSGIILKNKNIGVDFFLCGNYIASLLAETGNTPPASWYAVDYLNKAAADDNPAALKQGANICFLICAVFPPRGQVRTMKLGDYEALGQGLYYNYYGQTGTIVAYFMSQQFQPMVEITKECIRELK